MPPTRPGGSDCARRALATNVPAEDLVPASGAYTYRASGRRVLDGAGGRTSSLPARLRVLVTPARDFGGLRCFRVQRRYSRALGDTATFVVRGPDVFLTELFLQTGGELSDIRPEPPILTLPGDRLEWSGSFGGATRGRYAGSIIGRRTLRVGGEPVKVLGFELRMSFSGEIRGTLRSEQWLATDGNVPVEETVEQRRRFGLDRFRLNYHSRLTNLRASPWKATSSRAPPP